MKKANSVKKIFSQLAKNREVSFSSQSCRTNKIAKILGKNKVNRKIKV